MTWTAADIPDLDGRTAVVTGANGGLGLETARALAGAGARVVMAARNQDKAAVAVEDIRGDAPEASLEVVALDLGSQASVREAAGRVAVAIHDSGPGIAAEDLPRVFDRFFTTRGARRGTGLGLALVRAVVQAHQGRVEVTSTTDAQGGSADVQPRTAAAGATFTLSLPRA
jgi:signal transduction histidine kinase